MPQGCGCGTGGGAGGSCADVGACVANMVDGTPCLDVTGSGNDQALTPVISQQAGNLLRCAPDGLLVEGEITPTFCSPPTLPTPFWIADGNGPMAPWGSEAYLDAVLAHRLDGIYTRAWAAPDGVFVWGISTDDAAASYYLNVDYQFRQNQQPTAPANASHGEIDSLTWRNALSVAGTGTALMPDNTDRQAYNPDRLDGDGNGGWWGWGAAPFSPMTLQQALDRLACRTRAFLRLSPTNFHDFQAQANLLVAELSASGRAGGVVGVLPHDIGVTTVAILTAGGIATAADLRDDYTGDGTDLVADGFTYAIADVAVYDAAQIAAFTAAGLQVIAELPRTRHYLTQAAVDAGAAGVLCGNPVYARAFDDAPAATYFKRDRMFYDHNRHLGTSSNRGDVDNGYVNIDNAGRYLWVPPPTNVGDGSQAELLLGDLDIPDPTNFAMSWRQVVSSLDLLGDNSQFVGIFFGNPVDVTAWRLRAEAEGVESQLNGYMVAVRASTNANRGNIYVFKYTAGVASTLHDAEPLNQNAHNMSLQVTPSAFTVRRHSTSWTTTIDQVIVSDPDFRGPYVWAVAVTSGATNQPMLTRFLNVQIGLPT